jgi:hypothetical protein
MRRVSNEQKTAHGKQTCNRHHLLQRINFKKHYVTLDPCDCRGCKCLKLIKRGEYDRLVQNVKLKLPSDLTVVEKVNFTDTPQVANK